MADIPLEGGGIVLFVLAEFHHADVKFATTAVASTTLFSLAVIPAWMILVTMLIPS